VKIVSIPQATLGNPAQWTVNPGSNASCTLTFLGATTTVLTISGLTAVAVQAALQALSTIGPGNVLVTLSSGIFTVTLAGRLAPISQPSSALTGAGNSGAVTIIQTNAGSAALAVPAIRLEDTQNIGLNTRTTIGEVARDTFFLPGGSDGVFGGNYTLGAGLSINIAPFLTAYRLTDGVSFDLMSSLPVTLTLQPADGWHPRIDLIVAIEQEQVPSVIETRHYRVSPPIPGNQEGDLQVATQLWDQLQLQVVTGTPAVSPTQPALPANAILLYAITVPPNALQLVQTNIADMRRTVLCQEAQDQILTLLQNEVNSLLANQPPYPASEVLIGPGAGYLSGDTAQAAFALLAQLSDTQFYDPLIFPQTLTSDGRLGSIGNVDTDGITPVVDTPPGLQVEFSNVIQNVNQTAIPASANPRLVNVSEEAGTQSYPNNVSPLTLANVLNVIANGPGSWVQANGSLPAPREFNAAAARDGRYIENFGGTSPTQASLSDWFTYDTLAGQCTSQTLTGAIPPPSARPFMAPCGDGINILLGCPTGQPGVLGQTPVEWFIVNTSTWVSTSIGGGPSAAGGTYPYYWAFCGDLVQPNAILVFTQSGSPNTYWSFTWSAGPTVDGVFTKLNVNGQQPSLQWESSDACLYQSGTMVEFETSSGGSNVGNATYLFNYRTSTWNKQSISSPANLFADDTQFFDYFRMRNFGGLPTVAQGTDESGGTGQVTGYWQLTPGMPPSWAGQRGNLPHKWLGAMASLIANGLPQGQGFVFGGSAQSGGGSPGTTDIWTFTSGGIIVTTYGGQTGLTLAPGVDTASIQFTNFQVPLAQAITTYLISLFGYLPPGTVQIAITLNGGAGPPQGIIKDVVTTVTNSSAPAIRTLTITLTGSGSIVPILTGFSELFEIVGGPGLTGAYLRYNAQNVTTALYINRDGSMDFSTSINPSVAGTAILLKTTWNGSGVAPGVKNYVNMRRFRLEYTGTKGSGTPQVNYDGSRSPAFVYPRGIAGGQYVDQVGSNTGVIYRLPTPTVAFDATVSINGLQNSADGYELECES
jgi:hypothetical protein